MKVCVVMATYNNEGTLCDVVDRILKFTQDLIVVNDGSTDSTRELLSRYKNDVMIVDYRKNRGKGYALKTGLQTSLANGYAYAITIDSDGQHYPEDIPLFVNVLAMNRGALIVGCRDFQSDNMPGKNIFANRFSNFWFRVLTFINLPDTQTGFRLYPLKKLANLKMLTSRYEAELELLVGSAWRGTTLIPIMVNVYYPEKEKRVSHFRPFSDFLRLSLLNASLCIVAIFFGWPSLIIRKIRRNDG